MVGQHCKVVSKNRLAKSLIFDDTAKKKDYDIFFITVLCVSVTKEIPCFEREKSTIVEKFNCFLSLWAIAASIPDTLTL